MTPPDTNLMTVLPELIVGVTAIIVVLLDLIVNRERRDYLGYAGILGLLIAGGADVWVWSTGDSALSAFGGSVVMDGFTLFTNLVFLAVGILVLLLSPDYLHRENINLSEYYVLVLAATCGMMLMGTSSSLMTIFLALELFSICLYVLAGVARVRPKSQEAAVKYFPLSAFASGFLLYGMALTHRPAGPTPLPPLNNLLAPHPRAHAPPPPGRQGPLDL